jgi:methylmalonyl-CoA/ethylmalonyl-CoA epimerase
MHPRGVHHIGHAVADLDAAVELYRRLFGARCERRETLAEQGVEAAAMLVGGSKVELVAPTGEDTPVGRFLLRRGPGVHHVAYHVDDVATALASARDAGVELIDEEPRRGLFGTRVAFIHPHSVGGVLIELVQTPEGGDG